MLSVASGTLDTTTLRNRTTAPGWYRRRWLLSLPFRVRPTGAVTGLVQPGENWHVSRRRCLLSSFSNGVDSVDTKTIDTGCYYHSDYPNQDSPHYKESYDTSQD